MNITLYTNSSDKKVIGKTLTSVATKTCVLLDDCSIINPKITLAYASNILIANYVYIPDFSRYYFIDSVEILSGKRLQLSLSIDVLETYKTQIKGLTCIIKRNTNIFNQYLDDPYFQTTNKQQIQIIKSTSAIFSLTDVYGTTPCYLLTVAKG